MTVTRVAMEVDIVLEACLLHTRDAMGYHTETVIRSINCLSHSSIILKGWRYADHASAIP